ncbi:CHAT domain-containing protein [Leptolyngbya iicbica]|uniref:CHAT domain-containing protein n=2 Tax=Cyanophyceae TaxID=3028117 RepID=A0A4Q7EKS0_9CYAN|nr:CHAT domain-containing protein [Leptolyngbya sp. LK]RZM82409.1 CHAT domain-containing protein [Leptolyngbya sp. LK]
MTQLSGPAIATLVTLYTGLSVWPAQANDIVPAPNRTGTQVTTQGADHIITGGATSADQQNLFHQFAEFNLSTGASATFLTDPAILNILSGVNGANPSVIDGLLQVSGSNANLYLINPNGILFGPNAALNLQGSFTALTADQVGFAAGELDLVGANDYAALVGSPQSFGFSLEQPASVVNAGNLQVSAGTAVVLVGGQVLNTGTIAAPGGNILISAVAGGSRVRITQEGQLLNLELATLPETSLTTELPFSPLGLPELLTGNAIATATDVTVNPDGTITLGTGDLAIPTAPATTLISGQLNTDGTAQGGAVTVLGDTVGLFRAAVSATGATGGGTIRVGGDYTGGGSLSTASVTFVDEASSLVADAIAQGNGGTIILWSEETTRSYGFLSARGGGQSGNGGLIETSSRGFLETTGVPDITAPNGQAGHWLLDPRDILIVDAPSNQTTGFPPNNPFVAQSSPAVISWLDIESALSGGGTVTVSTGSTGNQAGDIDVDGFVLDTGTDSTLVLRAARDITINGEVSSISGATSFDFRADTDGNGSGEVTIAAPLSSGGGNITLRGNNVFVTSGGAINPQGGTLTVTETGQTSCPDGCQNPPPEGPDDFGEPGDFGGDFEFEGDDFGEGPDDFGFEGDDFGFEGDDFGEGPDDFGEGPDDFDDGPGGRGRRAGRGEADGPDGEGGEEGFEDGDDFEGDEFAEDGDGPEPGDPGFDVNAEDLTGEDWAFEDGLYAEDFVSYFDLPVLPEPNFEASQGTLRTLTQQVGTASALVYARFIPAGRSVAQRSPLKQLPDPQPTDVLQLVVVTPDGQPQQIEVPAATREKVVAAVRSLQIELTDRTRRRLTTYLQYSQQLYDWLIAPIEPVLAAEDIGHISMIMAPGLRSLPLAALHDGEQFIIENYSVGLMPSLALTDTRYTDVRRALVLAMGASEFTDQPALPAVPFELSTIVGTLRQGQRNLNESFTPQTLVSERQADDYQVLHLATHGEFRPGGPANSYIQFWDRRLSLDQIPELQLNDPPVELLVMSACKTALGDTSAELGFAGLAVQAGVRSALASLWQVSDLETAGLMAEFYTQLSQQPYKAEALRQAQLAMLRGQVTVQDGVLTWSADAAPLPEELAALGFGNTQHPYYWAAFTLVGSPW